MPSSTPGKAAERESDSANVLRSPNAGLRYLVRTFGCQMNNHDSEWIAGSLDARGMQPAADESEADLIVFNTCCVRENADNRLYGNLGALKAAKAENPSLRIAVGGCLAQKEGAALIEKADHVDVVFGTHNLADAGDLLDRQRLDGGKVIELLPEPTEGPGSEAEPVAHRERASSAWVTIASGCDNTCTFCIVPYVRGREMSRLPDAIAAEIERLVADGIVEVTLLGQNVNSYGRDLPESGRRPAFAHLLRKISEIDGLRRIRFTSPHPKDLRPETISAMAELPKVMPQLHLPLQSGSDRVLAAMHRGYSAERYLQRLQDARGAVHDLAVSTDVIVAFPGETERDFQETLDVVGEARFDGSFSFVYSPRAGTPAAEMKNRVPGDASRERYRRLSELLNTLALESNQSRIGLTEELLIEGASKKDPTMLTGRTPQNRIVHIPAAKGIGEGSFVDAVITSAAPHHLIGEMRGPRARSADA